MVACVARRLTGSIETTRRSALGLASIVFSWTLLAPIVGLVVGILALSREPAGKTMATWGIVLNALMLAGVLFVALLAVVGTGIGFAFLPFALL